MLNSWLWEFSSTLLVKKFSSDWPEQSDAFWAINDSKLALDVEHVKALTSATNWENSNFKINFKCKYLSDLQYIKIYYVILYTTKNPLRNGNRCKITVSSLLF